MKMSKEKKMKKTFCLDCADTPIRCGKNPEDCMNEKEARLYFCKYDEHWPIQVRKGMRKTGACNEIELGISDPALLEVKRKRG